MDTGSDGYGTAMQRAHLDEPPVVHLKSPPFAVRTFQQSPLAEHQVVYQAIPRAIESQCQCGDGRNYRVRPQSTRQRGRQL